MRRGATGWGGMSRGGTGQAGACVSRGLQTGVPLVAAPAAAFPVMVRFQLGWRARAGCALAWDVLRARESAVDIGVCVSRGLQTGGQLVAAPAAAFPVMVRFQLGWRVMAGCAVAWDVLRARESAVDIGGGVSRGLQTVVPLVAAHAPAFLVMVRLPVDGLPGASLSDREREMGWRGSPRLGFPEGPESNNISLLQYWRSPDFGASGL